MSWSKITESGKIVAKPFKRTRAVVVAQLEERSLPAEIRGSNSVIAKFYLLSTALNLY